MNLMPNDNSAELGFLLAITVISAIVSYDWKHYVKYFVGRSPVYGSKKVLLIRWLFFIVFLASFVQMMISAVSNLNSVDEFFGVFGVAIITFGSFALIDGVFRFLWKE